MSLKSKEEGIYRVLSNGKGSFVRAGQELLLPSDSVVKLLSKERLFSNMSEEEDFNIFKNHVEYVKKNDLKGLSFINVKPSTLLKYAKQIVETISPVFSKIVVEVREDWIEASDLSRLVALREEYPFLLSLDDFGKGASNIDRLRKLYPNFIKIEMGLLSVEETREFLSALKSIVRDERVKFVAERVENAYLLEEVRKIGFDYWQGYYEKELNGKLTAVAQGKRELPSGRYFWGGPGSLRS